MSNLFFSKLCVQFKSHFPLKLHKLGITILLHSKLDVVHYNGLFDTKVVNGMNNRFQLTLTYLVYNCILIIQHTVISECNGILDIQLLTYRLLRNVVQSADR